MAAPRRNRSKPSDPAFERARQSIQITQIINRLQNYALGLKDFRGNEIIMSRSQIKAAFVLLNKRLPDLKAVRIN
tara:strand:- start:1368 stop:1592 length:225 start_codon:yes stop_codon:yes gene_type:complete